MKNAQEGACTYCTTILEHRVLDESRTTEEGDGQSICSWKTTWTHSVKTAQVARPLKLPLTPESILQLNPNMACRIDAVAKFAAALLLSCLLGSPLATQAATVFGTESGWDVGGTAPLCWVTNLTAKPSVYDQTNKLNYTNVEVLNEDLYGEVKPATLLPSCYEGTSLTVEPLDVEHHHRQLITDTTYTFRLTLKTNVSNIDPNILVGALNNRSTIHVRLQLCDAIQQGFCSPMWDSRILDSDLTPAETDLGAAPDAEFPDGPAKWNYVPGEQTLLGIAKAKNGTVVFMRWCRWTLRQLTPDSPALKTAIDISFQLPKGMRTGAYFFIGHAVMNFDMPDGVSMQRIDVAEAIPDNVVEG